MSTLKPMSVFELCDDILELVLIELLPRQRYNQVVREYKDHVFTKALPGFSRRCQHSVLTQAARICGSSTLCLEPGQNIPSRISGAKRSTCTACASRRNPATGGRGWTGRANLRSVISPTTIWIGS